MSTLVKDRKTSRIQYLATAAELHEHTVSCTKRLPKAATFVWRMPLIEAARSVLASASKLASADSDVRRRLKHVTEALENLEYFEALLSSFMLSEFAPTLKTERDFAYLAWGDLITTERKLLRGLSSSIAKSSVTR